MSWDDGKHTKVKRVQLTFDDVIRTIEVEYDGASVKSHPRGTVTVDTKSDGFTLSSDEYITEVNGYTKTVFSGDVITALTFKTNKKTYGTYGNKSRFYFSLNAPKDKQIIGFLGHSTNALNSINAHFGPLSPPPPHSTETKPDTDDAGGNHGGGADTKPGGTDDAGGNHGGGADTKPGGTDDAGGNHDGGVNTKPGTDTKPGTGIKPDTKPGTGIKPDTKPGTDDAGGNHDGSADTKPGTNGSGPNTDSSPQKVEPQGGKGGNQWDDGADHEGVTKIHVTYGVGIEQIRFDYVKSGQPKEGTFHGMRGNRSFTYTIDINHPDEYLLSVKGSYDSSNIIQGIQFKTNTKTSDYIGFEDGTQFSLEVKDKKIIGFHGFVDTHLNSLGAYFVPISTSSSSVTPPSPSPPPPPPNKSEAQGGNYGETFDDGAFDHVRKVYVGQGDSCVAYVKLEYEKGGKKETREHGKITLLGIEEFKVDSDDYITSMDVYVDKIVGYKSDIVTALAFKTFKGKTSHPFGITTERKYEIKDAKGGKLTGFHGYASDVLYAIGAYFAPTTN